MHSKYSFTHVLRVYCIEYKAEKQVESPRFGTVW